MLRPINKHLFFQRKPVLKEMLLCAGTALLLVFSFPHARLGFLAWFAFVPLFLVLEHKSIKQVFVWSYLTGVLFWAGLIYWLVHVTLLGTIILVLYLALFFGVFGLLLAVFPRNIKRPVLSLFFIPSLWVLLEYLRSHLFTGFPWALLGYSQSSYLPLIQIADRTGSWGVSFLVMMINAAVFSAIRRRSLKKILPALICFAAVLIYGYTWLRPLKNQGPLIRVSVVQGNIPQELKWLPEARPFILEKFSRLTEEAALTGPDLIIWPEAANPDVHGFSRNSLAEISSFVKTSRIPLVLGTVVEDEQGYFNSALLMGGQGQIISRYDKLHLVPFGEYIPLRKMFPFLETIAPIGDITAGKEYALFKIPDSGRTARFGVLICFEDLFPVLSRQFVRRGAGFLVNITNDAWYKQTAAPWQHFQACVLRAVENRVFLVRCANTGVSGFINPQGRVLSLVRDGQGKDLFVDGVQTQEIRLRHSAPGFYTLHGDVFVLGVFIFSILCGVFFRNTSA